MMESVENGWMVTTPIYIGSSDDVTRMTTCRHQWNEQSRDEVAGEELVMERCGCGAVRARHRPKTS